MARIQGYVDAEKFLKLLTSAEIDAETDAFYDALFVETAGDAALPAIAATLASGKGAVRLADLGQTPTERSAPLPCLPLMLRRAGQNILLPAPATALQLGDAILFAGRPAARAAQQVTIANVNVLDYVRTGRDIPGGWIWQRLTGRST